MHQPVMLDDCQHSFCMNCISPIIEGKKESDTKCKTCNKLFPAENNNQKNEHEKNCVVQSVTPTSSTSMSLTSISSTTLSDVFEVKESGDISRNMEDAALHILKTKLKDSANNTVEFCSGGPRVSDIKQ